MKVALKIQITAFGSIPLLTSAYSLQEPGFKIFGQVLSWWELV